MKAHEVETGVDVRTVPRSSKGAALEKISKGTRLSQARSADPKKK